MANIPVQRKQQGVPWWAWVLLALGLFVILALVLWNVFQDRQAAAPPTTGAAAPSVNQAAPAGPITDLPIGQPDQLLALVGRPVQLSGVRVQDVVGDKTFWIGPSDTQRLFVFLEENQTPGQKVEGSVDVNQGQTVAIDGELRKLPSAEEAQQQWDISPQTFEALKKDQVYLYARSVKVISGS